MYTYIYIYIYNYYTISFDIHVKYNTYESKNTHEPVQKPWQNAACSSVCFSRSVCICTNLLKRRQDTIMLIC